MVLLKKYVSYQYGVSSNMLPATKMRIKILESIQKRDAEKCLSILDEDERFGTPFYKKMTSCQREISRQIKP